MEFLRSLWSGQGAKPQISVAESENTPNALDNEKLSERQQLTTEEVAAHQESIKHWDSKVVEFFKDFPEPYRQKAIDRFSNRQGLHRLEIFREMAMSNEMRSANKGVFLEDQREYEEMVQEQRREQLRLAIQEEKDSFYSRDIPPWEQKVMEFVPLQPGDKMWLKLALSANVSAFGVAFLAKWWTFQRRSQSDMGPPKGINVVEENMQEATESLLNESTPAPPRQKVVKTLVGSVGVFCMMQVVAVYRLMDWGPFDRSVDERGFLTKVAEDCKRDLKIIQNHIEEKIMK